MQVENLPIYRATYELLTKVMQYTKNFNKDYKFSLGKKLHEECIDLVVYVYKANSAREERKSLLNIVLEKVKVINLIIRLCKDLILFSVKQYANLIEITNQIGKQAFGWNKSTT